jgi:hypothetical protein
MEYCDGGTLRQALDAGRLLDPATGLSGLPLALALGHQVAAAMTYLHEEGIIRERAFGGRAGALRARLRLCARSAWRQGPPALADRPAAACS